MVSNWPRSAATPWPGVSTSMLPFLPFSEEPHVVGKLPRMRFLNRRGASGAQVDSGRELIARLRRRRWAPSRPWLSVQAMATPRFRRLTLSGIRLSVAIGLQAVAVLMLAVVLTGEFAPSLLRSRVWLVGMALLTVIVVTPLAAVLGFRYGARMTIRRMVSLYLGHHAPGAPGEPAQGSTPPTTTAPGPVESHPMPGKPGPA